MEKIMNLFSPSDLPKAACGIKEAVLVSSEDQFKELFDDKREDYGEISKERTAYSSYSGEEQHITIFTNTAEKARQPLVVYVPGSGWNRQDSAANEPYMLMLARKGYVAARAEYRPSEVAPFPAQVIDCKNAIRFMIANKDKYNIDTDRIAVMGDSSGGHTVLMAGITGNGYPSDDLYSGIDFKITCIVDQFGVTELKTLNTMPSCYDITSANELAGKLLGGKNVWEAAAEADEASPLTYVTKDRDIPPILILHGNRDTIVPFGQSEKLYNKLIENGKTAELVIFDNAGHWENGFHSRTNLKIIGDYLDKYLK